MLILNADETFTMGTRNPNGNNFFQVAVAPVDGILSELPAEATVITIEKDEVFALAVDGGYLWAGTSSSNYLRVEAETSSLTEWDITISEEGLATIVCHDPASERNTIRYNDNSKMFSAYKGDTQKDVVIFVEFEPTDAVDNIMTNGVTVEKFIQNGRLYIVREGKVYTVEGVQVR
jgi:hypothetical protein